MSTTTHRVPAPRAEDETLVVRNYCADMRSAIDEATQEGSYTPRLVASEVVAKLRATDPDLLNGWLQEQAEHFVWQAINDRDRSIRAATRHREKSSAFDAAVKSHLAGDDAPLLKFMDMPFTVADGRRKKLAKLDKADLLFVRDGYRKRAEANAFWANVTDALAKKVGDGIVEDHYTEEQLAAMFGSQV